MKHQGRRRLATAILCATCHLCCGRTAVVADQHGGQGDRCSRKVAVETDGHRRLALIVGVGQYENGAIPDLIGPPKDAERFYQLLTGERGYGFPTDNVCLLLDDEATTAELRRAFQQVLLDRIADRNDVAVFYYAGHGSQARDRNGDEPDQMDETFMLHDARSGDVGDLLDDELNTMLGRLREKTDNATVILDSCNSGTAMRAASSTYVARYFEPAETADSDVAAVSGGGDGGADWYPEDLPGVIVFSAASDGTPALETGGRGIFTDALITVLSATPERPLTYAQAARQAPPLVAAESYQIPSFHGDLDKPVFGNTARRRPVGWEIRSLGPPIELGGPPLTGIGKGAELRVFDGTASGADARDPARAKGVLVVENVTGLNATARLTAVRPDAPGLVVGDLATLVRPADEFLKLDVRLRPSSEPGGIAAERAAALRQQIAANPEASMLVGLSDRAGDFELSVGANGKLLLRGPENQVRNVYENDAAVADNLWQHARQRALLHLRGEGGSDFVDNETLQVRLVPAPASRQTACADGTWPEVAPNSEHVLPLCHAWNVEVTLQESSPHALQVGGVVLSTDGASFGFPADGRKELIAPGQTVVFDGRSETFRAQPPLDVRDHIIVFGSQETNPVPWHQLTATAASRSGPKSGLYRALDSYLQPGTRGVGQVDDDVVDTTWTLSSVGFRVEANQRFLRGAADSPPTQREYTLQGFDIRPYLPDDRETAVYRVLAKADWLARASVADGYSYKQHAWDRGSDKENLERGIDCSRAIWFAFTRSGLTYNEGNQYLTTARMVGETSPMREQFDRCDSDTHLRLGDVVVYRDDARGDGHVVMVIDPDKRIAWGSHGWDGSGKLLGEEPDTGVEYQLIKFKQDWQRWDRKTMARKACWRYRRFAQERQTARGLPGLRALDAACDPNRGCGAPPPG